MWPGSAIFSPSQNKPQPFLRHSFSFELVEDGKIQSIYCVNVELFLIGKRAVLIIS